MTKPVHLRVIDAAKTQPPPPSDLPTIKIEDGSLPENVAAVGAALARAPDLFTFGERFVHLHRSEKGGPKKRWRMSSVVAVRPFRPVKRRVRFIKEKNNEKRN